jgi:hypothetical protein
MFNGTVRWSGPSKPRFKQAKKAFYSVVQTHASLTWIHKQGNGATSNWLGQLGMVLQQCKALLLWACGPVHELNLLSWTGLKVQLSRQAYNPQFKHDVRLHLSEDEVSSWTWSFFCFLSCQTRNNLLPSRFPHRHFKYFVRHYHGYFAAPWHSNPLSVCGGCPSNDSLSDSTTEIVLVRRLIWI